MLLFNEVEAFWLAISRALNSRQSVSACDAGKLSGMPSFSLAGSLEEPSLLSALFLQQCTAFHSWLQCNAYKQSNLFRMTLSCRIIH